MAEYYEGNFFIKYYVKIQDSDYINCYDMDNFDNNKFVISSIELNKIIYANRLQLSEDKRWNAIVIIVDSSGKMNTNFDYAKVIEDQIDYEEGKQKENEMVFPFHFLFVINYIG